MNKKAVGEKLIIIILLIVALAILGMLEATTGFLGSAAVQWRANSGANGGASNIIISILPWAMVILIILVAWSQIQGEG